MIPPSFLEALQKTEGYVLTIIGAVLSASLWVVR